MSFLSNLRLAGITKGMTGTPYDDIPKGPDPMMEMINLYQQLQQQQQQPQIQNIAQSMVPQQGQGQVRIGGSLNPNLAAQSAWDEQQFFSQFNKPEPVQSSTVKSNGQPVFPVPVDPNTEKDKELDRDVKRANIKATNARAEGQGKLKVVNIADPEDPKRMISANYDEETGTVTPIKIDGGKIQPGASAKVNATNVENEKRKVQEDDLTRKKATDALGILDQLADAKGNLTPDTQTATGYSANMPYLDKMPFGIGTGAASAGGKIDQLESMLTLDLIADLKARSKTGATGFGALNLKELGVLQSAASRLKTRNMSEPEFAKALKEIREQLSLALQPGSGELQSSNPVNAETLDSSGLDRANTPPPVPQGFSPDKFEAVRRPDNKGWTFVKKVNK